MSNKDRNYAVTELKKPEILNGEIVVENLSLKKARSMVSELLSLLEKSHSERNKLHQRVELSDQYLIDEKHEVAAYKLKLSDSEIALEHKSKELRSAVIKADIAEIRSKRLQDEISGMERVIRIQSK